MAHPSRPRIQLLRGAFAAALLVVGATVIAGIPAAGPEPLHPMGTQLGYDVLKASRGAKIAALQADGWQLTPVVNVDAALAQR